MTAVPHNSKVGRPLRTGDAVALGVPTDELARDAVRSCEPERAWDLVEYAVAEAEQVFAIYATWLVSLIGFGTEQVERFDEHVSRLQKAIGRPAPLSEEVAAVGRAEREQIEKVLAGDDSAAFAPALLALRKAHWETHDAQADWAWGLLSVLYDALGEDRMEEVFRLTQADWLAARYAIVPELTQRELFELTIEGMRGHYCGPTRGGEIDIHEDDEKWVMSFDPCGSGGRMRRGDPERGQAPRTGPPFDFVDVENAYDWTWGEPGVCLYCAHCAFVNEILPIEQHGVPMRVTEYPQQPGDPCRWTVYKDVGDIPEEAYTRVGASKPPGGRAG